MVDLRIIFMGTPEFAVPSLQCLVESNWPIVAVITAPDRKKGRGQLLAQSPIKEYATANDIPVLQPTNLKSSAFLEELKSFKANLQIVVAFRMLPEVVWQMPELGTFNLHASLLPNYRGAAPINWAIINGEKETGVTTFFLQHKIDTGEIIMQEKEPIYEDDTVDTLYNRLMQKGSKLVLNTVKAIASGSVTTMPQQENTPIKPAPKIFRETCEINWHQPFKKVNDFVRGLNPYPTAWTRIDDKIYKIYALKPAELMPKTTHEWVVTDHKTKLLIKCADKWASIQELQMEGKKRMEVTKFLRGNPLPNLPMLLKNI